MAAAPALAAVDAIDVSEYDPATCGEIDASGGQRVYNGSLDAGALEGDWRPVYKTSLGGNGRFAVRTVDPGVYESSGHTVVLGPDMKVVAAWTNRRMVPSSYVVRFKVSGSATLSVMVDEGEPLTFTASEDVQEYGFTSSLQEVVVRFAVNSSKTSGQVELIECFGDRAFSVIIR